MHKSTANKQQDILNTQENVEETHKENSTITENERIENTPFRIVKDEEGKYFLTMGEYRITEKCDSKIIALDKLKTEKWLILMHMIVIVIEKNKIEENTTGILTSE